MIRLDAIDIRPEEPRPVYGLELTRGDTAPEAAVVRLELRADGPDLTRLLALIERIQRDERLDEPPGLPAARALPAGPINAEWIDEDPSR